MKKLRSGLSLVLVLAMVLSLFTVAFGWETDVIEYPDQNEISDYAQEAVATLSGMGIINGTDGGVFDPSGDFTREQAAKIVVYMLLGPDAAEALKCSEDPFDDVAADRWSAPYIAYAVNQKILAGNGDGTFDPEGVLTAPAWLKMLLIAATGADSNKYIGEGWDTAAQADALSSKLINAKEATLEFNREVAVLYAFNALKWSNKAPEKKYDVYRYSYGFGPRPLDDEDDYFAPVATFDTLAEAVLYAETLEQTIQIPDGPTINIKGRVGIREVPADTLGYKVFGMSKTVIGDSFGREITQWTNGKNGKDRFVYSQNGSTPDFVYTDAVDSKKLEEDLGENAIAADVWVDGDEYGDEGPVIRGQDNPTGNGVLVEFYKIANPANPEANEYRVVIVNTYVRELTKEDILPASKDGKTPAYVVLDDDDQTDYKVIVKTDAYKPGDVIAFTFGENNAQPDKEVKGCYVATTAQVLEPSEGAITAGNANGRPQPYVKIDGETKNFAENFLYTAKVDGTPNPNQWTSEPISDDTGLNTVGTNVTFYYDEYGYVLYSGLPVEAQPDGYLVKLGTQAEGSTGGDLMGKTASGAAAVIQMIDLSADEKAVTVENIALAEGAGHKMYYAMPNGKPGNTEVTKIDATYVPVADLDIYGYYMLGDEYVVDENGVKQAVTLEQGKADLNAGGLFATSATKVTIIDLKVAGNYVEDVAGVTTYTGIANFPKPATTYPVARVVTDPQNDKLVTEIIALNTAEPNVPPVYAVYTGAGETDADGVVQNFILDDGSQASYHGTIDAAPNSIVSIAVAPNGNVELAEQQPTNVGTYEVAFVDETFFKANGTDYYLAKDCKVVNASRDPEATELVEGAFVKFITNDKNEVVFVAIMDKPV